MRSWSAGAFWIRRKPQRTRPPRGPSLPVVLCDLAVETAAKAVLADLGPPTDFPGRGYANPLGELKKPAKGDQQLGSSSTSCSQCIGSANVLRWQAVPDEPSVEPDAEEEAAAGYA